MGRPSVASLPFPFSSKRREGRQWSLGRIFKWSFQPRLRFPGQGSVFPNRIPFSQTGLCFPRQDSVSPDRTPFAPRWTSPLGISSRAEVAHRLSISSLVILLGFQALDHAICTGFTLMAASDAGTSEFDR